MAVEAGRRSGSSEPRTATLTDEIVPLLDQISAVNEASERKALAPSSPWIHKHTMLGRDLPRVAAAGLEDGRVSGEASGHHLPRRKDGARGVLERRPANPKGFWVRGNCAGCF